MSRIGWLAGLTTLPPKVALSRLRRGPVAPGWSWRAQVLARGVRATLAEMPKHPPKWGRRFQDHAPELRLPAWAKREAYTLGGEGYGLAHERAPERGPVVFYLHGGGYVIGQPKSYAPLFAQLVRDGGRVVAPRYPLAPEHTHKAMLDTVLKAYLELVREVEPGRIVIAGDSAGGALALSLCRRLVLGAGPPPAGSYLISPWVDPYWPDLGNDAQHGGELDILHPDFVRWALELSEARDGASDREFVPYLGLDDLAVHAQGPQGELPMCIDSGSLELFAPQLEAYVARARDLGLRPSYTNWPNMVHVFHMGVGVFGEAKLALEVARRWMWTQVGDAPRTR